jgi:hypothetical protein
VIKISVLVHAIDTPKVSLTNIGGESLKEYATTGTHHPLQSSTLELASGYSPVADTDIISSVTPNHKATAASCGIEMV